MRTKLLASLKPHDSNEKNELVFRDSGITLNIDEPLENSIFHYLGSDETF
jgi:hypothetical protein